jgi:hypothetical protein
VQHRAPPRDDRPRAALGTWALVLSIVLALLSFFGGVVWIWMVPAALLAVYAVFRIHPAIQKGQGLAILALVISVLVGAGTFMISSAYNALATQVSRSVLAAVSSKNEPQRLDGWLTKKAKEAGLAETIRQRYAATVDAYGPYQKEILDESSLLGVWPYTVEPSDVVELGQGIGEALEIGTQAFWVRAKFEGGVIHMRTQFSKDSAALQRMGTSGDLGGDGAFVEDVRFYRPKDGDGPAAPEGAPGVEEPSAPPPQSPPGG